LKTLIGQTHSIMRAEADIVQADHKDTTFGKAIAPLSSITSQVGADLRQPLPPKLVREKLTPEGLEMMQRDC